MPPFNVYDPLQHQRSYPHPAHDTCSESVADDNPHDCAPSSVSQDACWCHSRWNGTSVMTIPRLNSSANRNMIAVWLCRKLCHHRPDTNCGTTMVMVSFR